MSVEGCDGGAAEASLLSVDVSSGDCCWLCTRLDNSIWMAVPATTAQATMTGRIGWGWGRA